MSSPGDDSHYDAAADESDFPEGVLDFSGDELPFEAVSLSPDEFSEDAVFSFGDADASLVEPAPEDSDEVAGEPSFDDLDSLAAGRLSFL